MYNRPYQQTYWFCMGNKHLFRHGKNCNRSLAAAGLAVFGDCDDNHCCHREITPTNKSRITAQSRSGTLEFTCGTTTYIGITSITTEGNKATVKYEREAQLDDALLSAVSACIIVKTEAGKQERSRTFVRDDSGKWSLAY